MIKDNYSPIFSIEVLHSFFEEKICDCLLFEPEEVTEKVMKRFGFVIMPKTNGFVIYCNTSQPLPVFFNYIKSATFEHSFDFKIKTDDENFWIFTELPFRFDGQIHYSSEKIMGKDKEDVVTLEPDFIPGKKGYVGRMRICFDNILSYKKDDNPAKFKLLFSSRSTQWQYYVINKSAVHVENPAINGKLNIAFDGPITVNIPTGEEAMLFTTANALLPLAQKPSFQLNLVNSSTLTENERAGPVRAGKILFKGLPWPDPGRIGLIEQNGHQVFSSPMYIYL